MEELEQQTKKWKARLTEIDADIAKYEKDGAQIRQKIETNHHLREELVLQQNTAKLQYDRANRDMEQAKERYQMLIYHQIKQLITFVLKVRGSRDRKRSCRLN